MVTYPTPGPEFQDVADRIDQSAVRLQWLLTEQSPTVLIARELWLLRKRVNAALDKLGINPEARR